MRLAALLLTLCLAGPAGAQDDALRRLERDPSAQATARLQELYRQTSSRDQRLWIVNSLGLRLKEHRDARALDFLLEVAGSPDPDLRGSALRALAGFSALPDSELRGGRLDRLEAAARGGVEASEAAVSGPARELQRALELWRDPSLREAPAPPQAQAPPEASGWLALARGLRWLWIVVLPGVILLWAGLGLPVFDPSSEEGRLARAAWRVLAGQKAFLAFSIFLWACLASILAGYGFEILVAAAGRPLYDPATGWWRAYFAAGLCLFLPGALAAAGFSARPGGPAASACLRSAPWALVQGLILFAAVLPLEVIYRLFLRRPRPREGASAGARDVVLWALDAGALRSGYLAAAVAGREKAGLWFAVGRARELSAPPRGIPAVGMGAFDPRFGVLCAAPLLAFFCALVARGQPVQWEVSLPVVLLGCSLWAWSVLAGTLFALAQALEGTAVADLYLRAAGEEGIIRMPEEAS